MPQIEFKTNELLSFYGLWFQGHNTAKQDYASILTEFPTGMENLPNTLFDFKSMSQDEKRQVIFQFKKAEQGMMSGEITTIDELIAVFAGKIKDPNTFKQAFQSYQKFCADNKEIIETNKQIIEETYQSKGFNERLTQIYKFFDVPQDKKQITYLHPYPTTPLIDGWATVATNQTFSIQKDEDEKNYIGKSTIKSRKISTPLHEATHALFNTSKMMSIIQNGSNPIISQFMNIVDNNLKSDNISKPRIAVLHEAFAATMGTAFVSKQMNKNFNPDTDELYHGFKTADRLAHCIYPVVEKYLKEGQKLDENFFKEVMESKEFQNGFIKSQNAHSTYSQGTVGEKMAILKSR